MHEKYNNLLQRYIDRELNSLGKIILEEHLANCQDCRRELNHLKLMDWDLKHQIAVEVPPELKSYRMAAINAHLADKRTIENNPAAYKTWRFQQHILQHTFSFISCNPVNRTVTQSARKSVSFFTRAISRRIKKRNPLLTRIIPGQA